MILEAAKVTLRQSKRFRTVAHANDCIQDVLEGLSELHKNGVVHLDIKPENIFLISDRHNSTEVRWRSCRSSAPGSCAALIATNTRLAGVEAWRLRCAPHAG